MPITVHVPTSLREFSAGQSTLKIECAEAIPLRDLFTRLSTTHPGITERVLDELGSVRQHVNVFVNGNSVRLGAGLATPVQPSAEIWILPAVSGG